MEYLQRERTTGSRFYANSTVRGGKAKEDDFKTAWGSSKNVLAGVLSSQKETEEEEKKKRVSPEENLYHPFQEKAN